MTRKIASFKRSQDQDQLTRIADEHGLDPAVARAVASVESGGSDGFYEGRVIIRFEVHKFWKFWGKDNAELFNKSFKFNHLQPWKGHKYLDDEQGEWLYVHPTGTLKDQDREYRALRLADGMASDTGQVYLPAQCMSMGMFQIMGFNYSDAGYFGALHMFKSYLSPNSQVRSFFTFLSNYRNGVCLKAAKNQYWYTFARAYNGTGQAKKYAGMLKAAYDKEVRDG